MSEPGEIEVLAAILCDDVRRTNEQSDIIIGTARGVLKLGDKPVTLSYSLYMPIKISRPGIADFSVEIDGDALAAPFRFTAQVTAEETSNRDEYKEIVLKGFPLRIVQTGEIHVRCAVNNEEPRLLRTIRTKLTDAEGKTINPPTASEQPS